MSTILNWIGVVPTVGAMIAAALEMLALAIIATIAGVAVPATPANVIVTFIVLATGHEILRRAVRHADDRGRAQAVRDAATANERAAALENERTDLLRIATTATGRPPRRLADDDPLRRANPALRYVAGD